MRLKKLLIVGIIAITLLVSGKALASGTWTANIVVTNNTTTTYSMLGSIVSANISYLVTQNYMNSTGNDTILQGDAGSIPYLLAEDKIVLADSIGGNVNKTYQMYTGQTANATPFHIVTGYGGYVTTTDAANLEPSANSSIEISGYWDTSANVTRAQGKIGAIEFITGHSTNNVTAVIYGQNSQTTQDVLYSLGSAYNSRVAQKFNTPTFNIVSVKGIELYLSKFGVPTGNATLYVRRVSDDAILGTIGTLDVSTLGALAYVTFTSSRPIMADSVSIRISLEYSGGDAANYISWGVRNADVVAGAQASSYAGAGPWIDQVTDMTYRNFTVSQISVSATMNSGTHIVNTTDNATSFGMQVDGGSWTTTTAAAVLNTASDWLWGNNSSMPYITYIKEWVGGNQQLYYAPNTIISGTNLPDRSTDATSNNGTITWGSNPAGISTSLTSFAPTTTTVTTSSIPDGTQDIVPLRSDNTTKVNPATATPPTTPISPIIQILAGTYMYNIPEFLLWVMIIFVASIISFGMVLGMFNHVGAAGVIGSVVWGLGIALVHLPNLWLTLSLLGIGVSLAQQNR